MHRRALVWARCPPASFAITDAMRVDPKIELDQLGLAYTPSGDKAIRVACPFHDDSTPSCDVFLDDGGFKCYACGAAGGFAQLLAKLTKRPQHVVVAELEARYGGDEKPIDPVHVERFHRQLYSNEKLMTALRDRAVSEDTIRKYRLGCDGDRITIPITDASGQWVNLRRYLPGATGGEPKFTNMKGRGKRLRLYPFEQLRYPKLLLCGGEIKALAAIPHLNPHGVGAICLSGGGEKDWSIASEAFFQRKQVIVCNDIDAVGVEASKLRCSRLVGAADWVGMLELPLDIEKYPHGDLNDYLHDGGDLISLLRAVKRFEPVTAPTAPAASLNGDEPSEVKITDINTARFVNKRVKCSVCVSAIDQTVYVVPRQVRVACGKDEEYCAVCPVFMARDPVFEIGKESSSILAIMDTSKNIMRTETMEALRIPKQCPSAVIDVLEHYKIVETRVQKSLDLSDHTSDKHVFPAVVVEDEIDLNETYEIVGVPMPHPKTQATTLLVTHTKPIADALTTFDAGDTSDLLVFRPDEWTLESIERKLDSVYAYYESSVTRIYNRPTLHRLVDLVFHSVLAVSIDGHPMKGWLELFVIGDSAQGKSDTVKFMCEYLGLGVSVDCANASVPGLLGGLENIGGKWFASWGILPQHDRRLVVLEELKELPQDVFRRLTNTRSSGRAEIAKIKKGYAQARTRLIALSNAHGTRTMDAYTYGVKAVQDIILKPEDIRRFDAVVVLNKNDIDPSVFNTRRPFIEPWFSGEQARRLILWSWTRRLGNVHLADGTWTAIERATNELCEKFTDAIPILDRGSSKLKLLRFAAAAACRTFSSTDDGKDVIVRPCHVEYIVKLLLTEYESVSNGYLAYSQHEIRAQSNLDASKFLEELGRSPNPKLLVERMLNHHEIELQDFCDWCAWSRDEASIFLSSMVRCNAIKRQDRNAYVKSPQAIEVLRNFAGTEVPDHIARDTEKY